MILVKYQGSNYCWTIKHSIKHMDFAPAFADAVLPSLPSPLGRQTTFLLLVLSAQSSVTQPLQRPHCQVIPSPLRRNHWVISFPGRCARLLGHQSWHHPGRLEPPLWDCWDCERPTRTGKGEGMMLISHQRTKKHTQEAGAGQARVTMVPLPTKLLPCLKKKKKEERILLYALLFRFYK